MFALLASSEEEVGGLATVVPPLYEVFWAAVMLLLLVLVVGRYGLPKIYAMLDERARVIEEGVNAADKAAKELARAQQDRDEILREANAEAHQIRDKANEDAKGIIAAARTEAQAEAARITEAAQRQILAEKQAAEISLRADVGLLATELAERIVGEQLKDTALTSRVVDRFLDELESANTVGEKA
ncbi:F0F1 ATP synthase subunit B [Schaalia sp. 19OD2882]|uniref:F0F1 ATP synthase subunit B n=1 Tax=Schaalia sp. 19OD2882 TaxID=2794089 RepID=UPI001C1EFC65|nr:F0F1 ATP synthase subunit B [Schaalia sp. 19OD2882]QWW20638.1 F0F1 ATP synthase subunit B [Schaalia sp. 19OD2882]